MVAAWEVSTDLRRPEGHYDAPCVNMRTTGLRGSCAKERLFQQRWRMTLFMPPKWCCTPCGLLYGILFTMRGGVGGGGTAKSASSLWKNFASGPSRGAMHTMLSRSQTKRAQTKAGHCMAAGTGKMSTAGRKARSGKHGRGHADTSGMGGAQQLLRSRRAFRWIWQRQCLCWAVPAWIGLSESTIVGMNSSSQRDILHGSETVTWRINPCADSPTS